MRLLMLSTIFLALSCAVLLYALNNETRLLEGRVQAQEQRAGALRSDIAVLKAERAHLARPERMEPAARDLGLEPPRPAQFADAIVEERATRNGR
ncbi:MAG: cell division protein FtsL [Hyphomicrobiaceae bacterium]